MVRICYNDLRFSQEQDTVKCVFQDFFCFSIRNTDLEAIGKYKLSAKCIEFDATEKKARNKLNRLIDNGFEHMKSANSRNAVYIHSNSAIPLIGNQYFGIVDRGSSLIELRPMTGCNLSCIYCSVDEGHTGRKTTDYFVEKDYLVSELRKLVEYKKTEIEAHINPQGEPLLYKPLPDLIHDISKFTAKISIDTNGILLTQDNLKNLEKAGLTQVNVSLNALDRKIASTLAGCPINPGKILKILESASIKVLIAPILVPGYNEEEIKKLILYCKEKGYRLGIQNFLKYKGGRNPAKPWSMSKFMSQLRSWEKEFNIKLIVGADDFNIVKTKELPKPFHKNDLIDVDIVCPGRKIDECIGVAKDRSIIIKNCGKSLHVKAKIVRTKHNIFSGIVKNS